MGFPGFQRGDHWEDNMGMMDQGLDRNMLSTALSTEQGDGQGCFSQLGSLHFH